MKQTICAKRCNYVSRRLEGWGNNDIIDVIKGLGYALKYEHKDVQSEPTNIITSQFLAVPKDF